MGETEERVFVVLRSRQVAQRAGVLVGEGRWLRLSLEMALLRFVKEGAGLRHFW